MNIFIDEITSTVQISINRNIYTIAYFNCDLQESMSQLEYADIYSIEKIAINEVLLKTLIAEKKINIDDMDILSAILDYCSINISKYGTIYISNNIIFEISKYNKKYYDEEYFLCKGYYSVRNFKGKFNGYVREYKEYVQDQRFYN